MLHRSIASPLAGDKRVDTGNNGKEAETNLKHVGDGALFTGTTALRYGKNVYILTHHGVFHPSFRAEVETSA